MGLDEKGFPITGVKTKDIQEMLQDFMLRFGQPCTFEDNLPEDDTDVEAIHPPYTSETENDSETTEEEDKKENDG